MHGTEGQGVFQRIVERLVLRSSQPARCPRIANGREGLGLQLGIVFHQIVGHQRILSPERQRPDHGRGNARESRALAQLPYNLAREVAALWTYYLRT